MSVNDSVDRVFVHALNTVRKLPRMGAQKPPPADRLKLYGLYKQSMEGDVEGVMRRPEGDTESIRDEQAKWDAWHSLHSISRTEAKRLYIPTLISTMHCYAASTPEARELVAELEFIWDQIKDNSSPDPLPNEEPPIVETDSRGDMPPLQHYPSYVSIGGGGHNSSGNGSGGGGGGRLRVLSPISHGNEVEAEISSQSQSVSVEEDEFKEARDTLPPDSSPSEREGEIRELTARAHTHQDHRYHRHSPHSTSSPPSSPENHKWRRRMERALFKTTTEIAALREQLEAYQSITSARRKYTALAWVKWLAWVSVRHLLVDVVVLGIVLVWMKRKGDSRLQVLMAEFLKMVSGKFRTRRRPPRAGPEPGPGW
ncbi:MAG: hypothetical protein M1834_001717 [Cirrosporium novae-zelandiae]|nr:MAG: hypothetical protein M1834_001717 [Cirrosporium novae-zelandiae]